MDSLTTSYYCVNGRINVHPICQLVLTVSKGIRVPIGFYSVGWVANAPVVYPSYC